MSEHDNDSLSQFFQKAAKDPRIEFNESDWNKLEAMLDANAMGNHSATATKWRTSLVSFAVVLLFLGGVYFYEKNDNQSNVIDFKNSQKEIAKNSLPVFSDSVGGQQKEATISLGSSSSHLPKNGLSPRNKSITILPQSIVIENATSTTKQKRNFATSKNTSPQKAGVAYKKIIEISNQNWVSESQYNLKQNDVSVINNQPIQMNEAQPLGVTDVGIEPMLEGVAVPLLPPSDSTSLRVAKQDTLNKLAQTKDPVSNKIEPPQKPETKIPSRWSAVLSFSPDFSSTSLSHYTSPGEAFGLVVHYQANSRLSLAIGAIRSHKIYEGSGSDYRPGISYWTKKTNGIVPQQIRGMCNVLEIPLSFQYKIAELKNSHLFISTGISSYIMLNESYQYTFEKPNPGADPGWNSIETSRFLFSIANLSASYERTLSPHMSIGLEPYIKIPLSTIGWSNVKLYTLGASITVRYRLLKNIRPVSPVPSRSPD